MSDIEKYKSTLLELHKKLGQDIKDAHANLMCLEDQMVVAVHDIQNMIKAGTTAGDLSEDLSWLNFGSINKEFIKHLFYVNTELGICDGELILFQRRYSSTTDFWMSRTTEFEYGLGIISGPSVLIDRDWRPSFPVEKLVTDNNAYQPGSNSLSRLYFSQVISKLKGEDVPKDSEWSVYIGSHAVDNEFLKAEGKRKKGIKSILKRLELSTS